MSFEQLDGNVQEVTKAQESIGARALRVGREVVKKCFSPPEDIVLQEDPRVVMHFSFGAGWTIH